MILKNNRGITLVSLVITIVLMLILSGASITVLISKDSTVDSAIEARNYTNIAGIEESIGFALTDENDIDEKIAELEDDDLIVRVVNSSNEEVYWITKEGMEKLAPNYANEIDDDSVKDKVSVSGGKITVNSLEDLLNTNMYVMDRDLKVSYISDKVYGEAKFKNSISVSENKWWKEK